MKRQWINRTTGENHSVDAELDDALLLGLNSLRSFHLDSICFGHVDGSIFSRKAFPYLLFTVHIQTAEGRISITSAADVIDRRFERFGKVDFQKSPTAVLRMEGPPANQDPERGKAHSWFADALDILKSVDSELTAMRCPMP